MLKKVFLIVFLAIGQLSSMESPYKNPGLETEQESDLLLSRNEADFIYSASQNNFEQVKKLSELVDVNVKNKKGSTALHWSSSNGYFDIANYLISRKKAQIDIRDKQRKTPLQFACGRGNGLIAKHLLNYNADPDLTDEKGDTALHWSIFNFHNDCAKKLIEHKAEINCQNNEGITPLNAALIVGNLEMTNLLLQKKAELLIDKSKRNPVHCAVWGNNLHCLKSIINALPADKKADFINARDFAGETPLHSAAVSGNWQMALMLIKHGADANLQCYYKERTPVHVILRNHKGTRIKAESINEYKKKNNSRLDTKQVINFIAVLKMSGNLDTTKRDYAGYSLFNCIEVMQFDTLAEKEDLMDILFNPSANFPLPQNDD